MPLVEGARGTLLSLELIDFKTVFRKVRAHVGEIGNEKAVQLAKEAAQSQILICLILHCPEFMSILSLRRKA